MLRLNRALVALAVAGLFVGFPGTSLAQAGKWIPPVKGAADIQVLAPVTKVDFKTNMVTTTIKVKNVSNGPIAGLTIEEFWWDKANNPVPGGDRQRVKKLLQPGEVIEVTLTCEKDKNMARNTYQFSHANGTIRAKTVKVF